MLITTNPELEVFVKETVATEQGSFVTMDTEFVREKTYWPELCLIQVATSSQAVLIDALAVDIAILRPLLEDPNILKVFHSARQDMEIFLNRLSILPKPLFDSQIGAMYASMGESISYENFIHKLLDTRIDKSQQYTDWSKRPMTEQQLNYALADVTFLYMAFPLLRKQLVDMGREQWPQEEMSDLTTPQTYEVSLPDLWLRIHMPSGRGQALAVLQDLAAWRERQAQRLNFNRGRVVKDDVLVKIALKPPATLEELRILLHKTPQKGSLEPYAEELWDEIQKSVARPPSSWPHWPGRSAIEIQNLGLHDLLKILQKQKAELLQIPGRLLVGKGDLERLANGQRENISCFEGWRYEAFGKDVEAFLDGRLSIGLDAGKVVLKQC